MFDAAAVAQQLREIHFAALPVFQWRPGEPPLETVQIGDASVCIDPLSQGGFPSNNRNRVQFLGVEDEVRPEMLDEIIELYRSRDIPHFYFWLSPGAQSEEIAEWLSGRGLEPFGGTKYPTLVRDASPPNVANTDLTIHRIEAEEAPALLANKGVSIFGEDPASSVFIHSLGHQGIEHFLAFDGPDIAATAMLQTSGRFAYLLNAHTLEAYRGRGGQSALIRARIERAIALGCGTLASETLYMLETSLGNLQRAGFEIIYYKPVWVWDK